MRSSGSAFRPGRDAEDKDQRLPGRENAKAQSVCEKILTGLSYTLIEYFTH